MPPSTNARLLALINPHVSLPAMRRCVWWTGLSVLTLACSGCGTKTIANSLASGSEACLGLGGASMAMTSTVISNPALQQWFLQLEQRLNQDPWEKVAIEYRLAELADRSDELKITPRPEATVPAISIGVLARDHTIAQLAAPPREAWSDLAAKLLQPAPAWRGLPISRVDPISPNLVSPGSFVSWSFVGGEGLLRFGALAFLTTILIVPAMCSLASGVLCRRRTARSPPEPMPVEPPGPRFNSESDSPRWPGVDPIAVRGRADPALLGRGLPLS